MVPMRFGEEALEFEVIICMEFLCFIISRPRWNQRGFAPNSGVLICLDTTPMLKFMI